MPSTWGFSGWRVLGLGLGISVPGLSGHDVGFECLRDFSVLSRFVLLWLGYSKEYLPTSSRHEQELCGAFVRLQGNQKTSDSYSTERTVMSAVDR